MRTPFVRCVIDAAIAAAKRDGFDALSGFHSQIAVYNENWSIDGVPPGLDYNDSIWGKFWIDGSADSRGKVLMLPPLDANIITHEIGHGFGMDHDLGPDLVTHYQDPCCIMSQMNRFMHPVWKVNFGPALCTPHLIQKGWMFPRRLYIDNGEWMSKPGGITLPLAPITSPIDKANLGIKLAFRRGTLSFDYYIEYVTPVGWNRGLLRPYVFIRRMAPLGADQTPAILGLIDVSGPFGVAAEWIEPSGNIKFSAERFDADGRVLKMSAKKL